HRPEYYTKSSENAEGKDIRGVSEFIIAKHRSGAVDDVQLRFVAQYARFENWDDSLITTSNTVESKMNSEEPTDVPPMPDSAPPFIGGASSQPAPNVDFLQGPGEESTPF
ncbi:MAG: hypothetical protein II034_00050, partial [Muribaculaceae bacterium]|nr:hypothetical protein [Muribaculaceae bacterium]